MPLLQAKFKHNSHAIFTAELFACLTWNRFDPILPPKRSENHQNRKDNENVSPYPSISTRPIGTTGLQSRQFYLSYSLPFDLKFSDRAKSPTLLLVLPRKCRSIFLNVNSLIASLLVLPPKKLLQSLNTLISFDTPIT